MQSDMVRVRPTASNQHVRYRSTPSNTVRYLPTQSNTVQYMLSHTVQYVLSHTVQYMLSHTVQYIIINTVQYILSNNDLTTRDCPIPSNRPDLSDTIRHRPAGRMTLCDAPKCRDTRRDVSPAEVCHQTARARRGHVVTDGRSRRHQSVICP